jgi:hypothetical protein
MNDLDILNEYSDDDSEYEDDWGDVDTIDEEVLISFLNEYYVVNPTKLPKSQAI